MSWEAEDAVVKRAKSKGTARFVLMLVARHADRRGRNAYPSVTTLADESGLSRDQVMNLVRKLVDAGELVCNRRSGPSLCNVYSIPLVDNYVDNPDGGTPEVVAPTPPSHKEVEAEVVASIPAGSGIHAPEVVAPMPPKHTVKPSINQEVESAGAREAENRRTARPVPKAESARKPARSHSEQPKEVAPAVVAPPEGAFPDDEPADLEALRADPVLMALAEAAAGLMHQPLETLSAGQAGALTEYRLGWNGQITTKIIADVKRKVEVQGPRIEAPAAYLLAALDNIAARPRAAPSNGHGPGRAPTKSVYQGLDPANYAPGGKFAALFHPPEVRVIKRGGAGIGKQDE